MECTVGSLTVTGTGRSKRAARMNAASEMLRALA
jgi:dsRNA-specific ribonuclease